MPNDRRTIHTPEDPIFKYHSDDPVFIENHIKENNPPLLCMVVRNDLSPLTIHKMVKQYYIFAVEWNSEERLAVIGGFYKEKQLAFDKIDPKLTATCNAAKKWVNGGEKDTPVLERIIEEPLSILISDKLELKRLEMMTGIYEVIKVGESSHAIACVRLDPTYNPGAKIISQSAPVFSPEPHQEEA